LIDIFNEKAHAEEMIRKGFLSTNIKFELRFLAKYYKFEFYKSDKEIKKILTSFCENWLPGFRYEMHYMLINSAIGYLNSPKCRQIIIDSIFISDEFVSYFNGLDIDDNSRKVLFTLGIWGKLNLELGYSELFAYSYNDYRDLRDSSNIHIRGSIFNLLHSLYTEGYIRNCHTGAVELNFLKDIEEGFPIYKISDFNNLGNWLDFYNGVKGFYVCEKCSKIFKKNNIKAGAQKYCKSCAGANRIGSKLIKCDSCGDEFFVKGKTNNKNLCNECYVQYRKEYLQNRAKKEQTAQIP